MKVVITGFLNTMTKPQKIAGFIYLPLHVVIIPLLLAMAAYWLPDGLGELTANIIYYSAGLLFCLICMWNYLRGAFDIMLDNPAVSISALIIGYFIWLLLSYLAAGALLALLGDKISNPNNDAVLALAENSPRAVLGLAVFIAPIVEETLFRGVVFGSLRTKHRTLAYIISIAAFAVYHVWQYALASTDWTLLAYAVQYIPAGYAMAWTYEKTNSIWIPIFLHMSINLMSMLLLT